MIKCRFDSMIHDSSDSNDSSVVVWGGNCIPSFLSISIGMMPFGHNQSSVASALRNTSALWFTFENNKYFAN